MKGSTKHLNILCQIMLLCMQILYHFKLDNLLIFGSLLTSVLKQKFRTFGNGNFMIHDL